MLPLPSWNGRRLYHSLVAIPVGNRRESGSRRADQPLLFAGTHPSPYSSGSCTFSAENPSQTWLHPLTVPVGDAAIPWNMDCVHSGLHPASWFGARGDEESLPDERILGPHLRKFDLILRMRCGHTNCWAGAYRRVGGKDMASGLASLACAE